MALPAKRPVNSGITIDLADLRFTHLCHHADPDGQARIGVFFTATRWTGTPVNAERSPSGSRAFGTGRSGLALGLGRSSGGNCR